MLDCANITRGYLKRLNYHISTGVMTIDIKELKWCENNCSGEYGWFFNENDEGIAYMTFENEVDAFLFKLVRVR